MPVSDADILKQVQRGDRELFGQLMIRYTDRFLRFAESKLGDRTTAEDVVQETFLAAYSARDSYKPQFAVSTWLWTILLNLCRTRWKRQQRRPWELAVLFTDDSASGLFQEEPTSLARMISQEESQLLHRLLDELPEPQADALRLRFFGGLAYDEIATATECSLSGAKRRVKTGLQRLAERLEDLNSVANPQTKTSEEER